MMIGTPKKMQKPFIFCRRLMRSSKNLPHTWRTIMLIWYSLQVILEMRMLILLKVLQILISQRQPYWGIMIPGTPHSSRGRRQTVSNFSWNGYGVHDMDGSAKKIFEAALGAPEGHSLVLLAHNGPTGLGSQMNDICGRDWVYGGGDHGDPDLAQAIAELKKDTQISIPLVVFGHMHKDLAYGNGLRKMLVVGDDDTVYLNGAIVPRVRTPGRQESCSRIPWEDPNLVAGTLTLRAFTLVETQGGTLQKISETWVSVHGNKTTVAEENVLFKRP